MKRTLQILKLAIVGPVWCLQALGCSEASVTHAVLPTIAPAPAEATVMTLKQSALLSSKVTLDEQDTVVAVGRLNDQKIVVSTASGVAYNVDIETGTVERVEPFLVFDSSKKKVMTASKNYTWELAFDGNLVGRNKKPPDAQRQFEIAKAPIGDLVSIVKDAVPLSLSEVQLLLLTSDAVVVLTWVDGGIKRQKIPLPGGALSDGEKALGGGPIGDAGSIEGVWMITNQRLMTYTKNWQVQNFALPTTGSSPTLLSMRYKATDGQPEPAGTIVGFYAPNMLSAFDIANVGGG